MVTFAIRVELHDASFNDYERLHADLASTGVRRSGEFGGLNYALPPAEYEVDAPLGVTAVDLCNRIRDVAAVIKANPAVVVTRVAERAAVGLQILPAGGLSPIARALSASPGLTAPQPPFVFPGNAMQGLVGRK